MRMRYAIGQPETVAKVRGAGGLGNISELQAVDVGRDFPLMEKTHTRISIGTMGHMERAMRVFPQVLDRTSM